MAAVPHHLISPHDRPLENAVDEPVRVQLTAVEDDLARVHRVGDQTARLGAVGVVQE